MYCFKSRCVLDEHCSRVVIVLFYQHLLYHELLALSLPHYKFLRAYSVTVLYLAAGLQVTSWSFSMLRTVLALWIISPRLQLPFSHFPQLRLRADSSIPSLLFSSHRWWTFPACWWSDFSCSCRCPPCPDSGHRSLAIRYIPTLHPASMTHPTLLQSPLSHGRFIHESPAPPVHHFVPSPLSFSLLTLSHPSRHQS